MSTFQFCPIGTPARWTVKEAMEFDAPCRSTKRGYQCTGPKGHDGAHHADGISRCMATWGGGK